MFISRDGSSPVRFRINPHEHGIAGNFYADSFKHKVLLALKSVRIT